ncbi:MAG: PEP-CTERM sorting domain-containing protein [Burkholderiales bacterium]|nr:PEP-CTERM sorting domain-containing protein [Burkholderiales bacterium]MBK9347067.1 PEP-CTERM sorting domain-containing protein [Burkholderiales bacterium]
MKKLLTASVFAVLGLTQAHAADFDFSGNIAMHNDVVSIDFSLASDATDVKVWTDSFQNAVNFDPITAVWVQSGSNWNLVGQNDDNASIAAGQTYYDSGLTFASLAAGTYRFTIATFNNFANGTSLSQGFQYDNQAPIALADWDQPANHTNMGSFYSVHLTGVDSAINTTPVPEPETYALMLAGLGLMGAVARRRNKKSAA